MDDWLVPYVCRIYRDLESTGGASSNAGTYIVTGTKGETKLQGRQLLISNEGEFSS
jgi:hypothetical protein